MKHWKIVPVILVVLGLNLTSKTISHQVRTSVQHNPQLYELILAYDAHSFLTVGGGNFGYQNFFKWQAAKALKNPNTPLISKILFWRKGILYDASSPPDKYQYQRQEHNGA
jgi:hypothetical protein